MNENESYQEHKKKKFYQRILEEKLAFIVLVPLLAIFITAFVFHFYRVDGSSMEETFQHNDFLLVEKLGRTTSTIFSSDYVPKRYDVVVFKEPSYSSDVELIKRVIGLPGDKVVIKDRKVAVFNKQNPKGIKVDKNLPIGAKVIESTSDLENLEVKIGPGEVFVLGDNRPASDDSRVFGPVDTDNIVGKVIIRILPFNKLLVL